jgi:predicted ATPase/signal transduction histidine kinase
MDESTHTYALGEKLQQGRRSSVYRAVRRADGHKVVLRVLDGSDPVAGKIERLKHELDLRSTLHGLPAVEPLALSALNGVPALELEDFVGEPLDRLVTAPLPIADFLRLAVSVTAAVGDIHSRGLIHKDLNPGSILFDPKTRRVKVANFGAASRVAREQTAAGPERLLEESLPYVSPERTGRMNRAVDSRSDLYSLGVTYYQLLTGRLPFTANDVTGWVHCHVARAPAPPARFCQALPSVLSEIVLKLLAKVPDDRYQSAAGLQRDLERCLRQWRETGTITPFALGAEDTSDRFLVPQAVYGREAECAAVREAFERVVATGQPELVMVSGPSGIGKSAVVYGLRLPIMRRQGLFLSAKFERSKRDIPYLALIRGFRELVLDILTGSAEQISAWRRRITDAVGPNGKLIADLLPEIELIVGPGPQPEPPELPLIDAENRLRMVVRQFACAFARPRHPLTLFLDDLQWVDAASANLVADLATDPDTRHVLLIGASRTDDVPGAQQVAVTLGKLRAGGAIVREIALPPLAADAVDRLVADTIHRSAAEAAPLARLVREKTGGNPFFAIHFLTALYSKRLITFDRAARRWTWDMARVRAESTTDNIADLLVAKLRELPRETQQALSLAAHIGGVVDGRAMAAVLGRDPEPVLNAAVEEDLMLRIDHSCRFPHDRVQEAAYSLVPESERAGLHLEIGRRLWARTSASERGEWAFEIATQLNRGASLIASSEERTGVAEINLSAGKRAKESAAYASALTYLTAGCALLSEDRWQEHYELTFGLEFNRAECEHLSGNVTAAERRLSALSRHARTLGALAAVTCAEVEIFHTSGRTPRAVEASLGYLRQVGIDWTPHPTEAEVAKEYASLEQALGNRAIESLVDLPAVSDPDRRATMDVLLATFSPALITDSNLHDLLVGRVARLSLAHGNSDASSLAYVRLATVLGRRFGDYAKGFRFGKLGFDLVEQRGLSRFKAAVYLNFAASVIPWTRHLSTGLELIRRSATAAEQTGNISYACYARTRLITQLLAQGAPLAETLTEAEEAYAYTEARFELVADSIRTDRQLIRMLQGHLPRFGSLMDADLDEETFEVRLRDPRKAITACWYWIRKLQARFHANDFAAAVAAAENAAPLVWTSTEFLEIAEYHFYAALAHAARHDQVAPERRARHRDALVAHARRLGEWARPCPDNFSSRAALANAELARIDGCVADAERLYESALTSARASGFVHDEAIAYEMAATFWRARGYPRFGDAYLQEACACYRRWGAEGKVRQLTRLHPALGKQPTLSPTSLPEIPATSANQLDLLAVIKASQTISGAMGREELVRTLLQIVIEQSGARLARLVRVRDGELEIAAEQALAPQRDAGETAEPTEPAPRGSAGRVPTSILHYVARIRERVLLDDAAADAGRFASEPYLAAARPRSLLCLPIRREGRVVALLYLENELAPGVFTPDRLVALELIAAQVAISLENALLLEREHGGRVEAEAASRRALILGEATALVSSTFDYKGVFHALTRLCARELCDWAVIDIVEHDRVVRIAAAHRDPVHEPLMRELLQRYCPRFGVPSTVTAVIERGRPTHLPDVAPEEVRRLCVDDRHCEIIKTLGARGELSVPLVAREVRVGALSLGSATPNRFDEADVELVVEIGRRTALAIDNARLLVETQRAVRLRDQFLSTASHELRTPITSLKLIVESLIHQTGARPLAPAASSDRLQRVLRSTHRLEHLVGELLDVTRIEQGQATVSLAEMDLAALVREVVQHFEFDLARAGCRVSVNCPSPVVGSVVGCWDASKLEQVVTNLLGNAIKFGAGRPIEVTVRDAGQAVELHVKDHGIGIAAADLPKIFDRFERAVSSTHYGGLGLGLYLVRSIVESHGGAVTVESRVNEGSTFTVRLPRTPPRQTP